METKVCTSCGLEKPVSDFPSSHGKRPYGSWCSACKSAIAKKLRQQRVAAGMCSFCNAPALPGIKTCAFHRDLARVRSHEWAQRKIDSGLCGDCGKNPIAPGEKYCEKCEGVRTATVRANKERAVKLLGGKCAMCGLETDRWEVYDFHHPERKASYKDGISKLLLGKWDKIAGAASKCILLCANCHRTLHTHDREGK